MLNLKVAERRCPQFFGAREPDFLRGHVDIYYRERVEKTWQGGHIMHGCLPGADSVLMVSNDYLNLANHPEIVAAQIETLRATDNTVVMSAVYLHGDSPQQRFEQRMADWLSQESSLLCQSGYAANVGLIQSVAPPGTPVFVDIFAHTSLWEGVQSAGLTARAFRHNSARHLESLIRRHGPGVVAVDSVYSTHGSVAPLEELVAVARDNGCVMLVDESHSLGTHGAHGEGLVASLGLNDDVHFVTASLAKTFAGRAGLIACSQRLTDFIKYNSFPAIFSSALLPQEIAGLDKTLDLIKAASDRRARLHANADYLRDNLKRLGYNVHISQSQIIALEAGAEPDTMVLRDALEARGIFGSVFCAPATAARRSLIRFSVNSALTSDQLDRIIAVCADIREQVGLQKWPSTRRVARDEARVSASA